MIAECHLYSNQQENGKLLEIVFNHLPKGNYKTIFIKPNWVKHQENPYFPIQALVTSSKLIDIVIEACLLKYKSVQEIIVGDVPLQGSNWQLLVEQAGIKDLIEKYAEYSYPIIRFSDLRRERYNLIDGFLIQNSAEEHFGDPKGYREVMLDEASFLESISHARDKFRVSDYNSEEIISHHRRGYHRYLISGSVLGSDLFINLPKIKTHQKSGITGALKNLVGISGNKAYLVHYRRGKPRHGGDEFPPDVPWIIVMQSRIREIFQKKSRFIFSLLRYGWMVIRSIYGIKVQGEPNNLSKRFYMAGGAWYGNDTIWRMIYDLNKIILYAPREGGQLKKTVQRQYFVIMDGIIAGEGNGPLQPLPIDLGLIAFSYDPFLIDICAAQMIGFDYTKIPMLKNFRLFSDKILGNFDPLDVTVYLNGNELSGISSIPIIQRFAPSPGWRGHIELPNIMEG